ncbi:MAG: beta-ketoacyl-ACP synthase III [Candidatus Dasytiphilus stammeri]
MYTKIIGTGSYFPTTILTNNQLEKKFSISSEWIITRTGIMQRHIAGPQDSVASIGCEAAKKAIIMAGIDKNSLGLIVVATNTSSHAFPSSACMIKHLLGINEDEIAAFDIAAACTGFIYALSVADQYIKTGYIKYALVIGADIITRTLNPKDHSSLVLFGDGAGAVVIGASKQPGILSTHLYSDGRYGKILNLPLTNPLTTESNFLTMSGNEVFKMAVKKLTFLIENTLKINNINQKYLDWIIPHQANFRIISATAKYSNFRIEKIIITIERYGNTSSASVPSSLDEAVRDGRIQQGNLILLEAFGGGLTWGSALLHF